MKNTFIKLVTMLVIPPPPLIFFTGKKETKTQPREYHRICKNPWQLLLTWGTPHTFLPQNTQCCNSSLKFPFSFNGHKLTPRIFPVYQNISLKFQLSVVSCSKPGFLQQMWGNKGLHFRKPNINFIVKQVLPGSELQDSIYYSILES